MKVKRRIASSGGPTDPRFTHLRDVTTGQVIVCGQCPVGDLRSSHWTTVDGKPVCLCTAGAAGS